MNGWLIFFGILFLIAIFPVGVSARYDEDGAVVKLTAGPIKILLFPRPKKEKKKEEPAKEDPKPAPKSAERSIPDTPPPGAPVKKRKKQGGSVTDFIPLVRVALDLLGSLRRKLRVDFLQLRLTLAGDDPCDLAVNYGRAQAAGGALMAQLERLFTIRHRDVEIQCDFESDKTRVLARLDLTITIGRVVSLAVVYGIRALTTFLKIKKQREGGALN